MSNFYTMRGGDYHTGLLDLIDFIGEKSKDMTMIEIGAYVGESTVIFANKFKKVISIDPFLNGFDLEDETCKGNYADYDLVYKEFVKNTTNCNNIISIKKLSNDAVSDIIEKVDFVYIDGSHQYEQVKMDIINYKPLIKEGGIIAGHDYVGSWVGVKKAVDELLGNPDAIFKDSSWIKRL